jgi:transcriptional antiterminator RfaH
MGSSSEMWYVLYTKPRNEIKVFQRLSVLGIKAYTPTSIEVRQWSDRKKKVSVPLLPSMVLVQLKEQDTDLVFNIPGVVRYLFDNGKRAVVLDAEVLAMKAYLESAYSLEAKRIVKGDTIQVPCINQEAILLSIKGKKCIAQLKKMGAIVSFQLN